MKSYSQFLSEAKDAKEAADKASSNTKGVLHELLVGYHLGGGKHMERHKNAEGDSPKQAHDKLKASIHPDAYKRINNKAKSAAKDLHHHLLRSGHTINHVHWTSKNGDIERSTGIKSTQKEDASDIMIKTHKAGVTKFHGVSLKVTDKASGSVPVSNPGMNATHGGETIYVKHQADLKKKHPELAKLSNKAKRKEWMAKNPEHHASIKADNTEALHKIARHTHKQLTNMDKKDLVKHIRNHILHAHKTPLQKLGHDHIKHTTLGDGSKEFKFHHADPSSDHEHILRDHKNVSCEHRGNSVVFTHKGKPFARHDMKFDSQSDPLSTIKGVGRIMGSH